MNNIIRILFLLLKTTKFDQKNCFFAMCQNQGDQKIGGKFAQFLDEVAKTVAKPKKCQNISSKLNLKVKIYTKPFLTLNIPKKQTIFVPKNSPGPLKSSPNGNISPNLVTLLGIKHPDLFCFNQSSYNLPLTPIGSLCAIDI